MSGIKSTKAQEHKHTTMLVTCALMICILFCSTSAKPVKSKKPSVSSESSNETKAKANNILKDSILQLYLPREVIIQDDTIRLGQISIIRGNSHEDELLAKASKIALGRITVPGQEIVIDRPMVLSRLACNGIPASKVELTGAEKVTVKRRHQIIKGSELLELASAFLKKNPLSGSVCQWEPIRIPKDLNVPEESKDIKLSPRLVKSAARNQANVQIALIHNGKQIGEREVTYRLKYNCRRAVSLVDIPAGTVINPENVKIENTISYQPEPANWKPPYGLIAKRLLAAKTVLAPNMYGAVKPAVIIDRNQSVVIRIEKPLLLVTAIGKAIQDGRAGEYIKVRNMNSQRIILAKVNEDGTVEPVF
jgi:flagella basal body P-ring formation protein FlgA